MSVAFTLSVPAEIQFRDLASDVARKYVELVGGTAADGQALFTSVAGELERLVDGDLDADIEMSFESTDASVGITLTCGARSAVVTQPLPARKS
jgi:hypothetical protein